MSSLFVASGHGQTALDSAIKNGTLPTPTKRPLIAKTDPTTETSAAESQRLDPLKAALDAFYKDGLTPDFNFKNAQSAKLDNKIMLWAAAISGRDDVSRALIERAIMELPEWPGQDYLRTYRERAFAREKPNTQLVLAFFKDKRPKSFAGALLLAKAYVENGNTEAARKILAPIWWDDPLTQSQEKRVLAIAGNVLTKKDHIRRMHSQFYKDRVTAANRMVPLAGQESLAKAWSAVIRRNKNADVLLKKVDQKLQKDPAFLFAKIAHARKTDQHDVSSNLLLTAPTDPEVLIDPDEWWTERRIASRAMISKGHFQKAYDIVAAHSAKSEIAKVDAEFHGGFYALRFLKDPQKAIPHFQTVLALATIPSTQARAYYWLGRASTGSKANLYFRNAARFPTTFYGQLAAQKIGLEKLDLTSPVASNTEKKRFEKRELVQAIKRLTSVGYENRARIFYQHLMETLNSEGEITLAIKMAEKQKDTALSLRLGKTAHYRGMYVDSLAWPIGAIPKSAKFQNAGRALAYAIARQESSFNKEAISSAGARGLLQLLPGTAKEVAAAERLPYSRARLTSDAAYNATLGAAYLSRQLDHFDNSYILTFAAYNAGPGRVREWLNEFGDPRQMALDDVIDWIERIPFTETRKYVQKIMENYQVYKARLYKTKLDIEGDLTTGRIKNMTKQNRSSMPLGFRATTE